MKPDPLEPRPHVLSQDGGRVIAWHEFGQTEAPTATVIYCHGTPGTGYEALFLDEAARELGIRIIAPDRPGLGASDAVPYRLVGTWAEEDAAAIIDHLELDRFSVIGFSGGGPHAMSLAALHPDKVEQLILLAPFTHHPLWESHLGLNLTPLRVHFSHLTLSWFPKPLIDLTSRALSRPLASASTLASALGRDMAVKPARARNLGLRLGAQIHELPRDGHFSLLINHAASVLAPVLQRTVNC